MNLIDLDYVFEVNETLDIQVKEESWGRYIYVDNFWKRPEEIKKLSLSTHPIKLPGIYSSKDNGKKYYDGRIQFAFYDVPKFSEVIYHIAVTFFNQDPNKLRIRWDNPFILFGNIFQMFDKKFNKYKTHHYVPHTDGETHIAATWYMNENYAEGEGTGLYTNIESPTKSPWCKDSKLLGVIPAKYNRLVMYHGNIPHAQIVTERWFTEKRISLVQFLWSPN